MTHNAEKQERLLQWLLQGLHAHRGPFHFKSRQPAQELGLTVNEAGANLSILQYTAREKVCLQKWGYSKCTTWRAAPP